MVMIIALSIVTSLFLLKGTSEFVITSLEEGVDITAYFIDRAGEDEMLVARQELLSFPGVKSVEYISREKALEQFVIANKDDEVILESLEAVGANPLPASLNIIAEDALYYDTIADFIEVSSFAPLISAVDFHDRVAVIERISTVTTGIQKGMLGVTIIIVVFTILIVFNTIRLTIYNSKEEIEIMRLVGSSNWFIRGPFIVHGMIVGVIASVVTFLVFFLGVLTISPELKNFIPGFSLFDFFIANLFMVVLLQLGVGMSLGVISSMIAIRRYLKV